MVKEASVLARVLKTGLLVGGEPWGEPWCGNEEVGYDKAPEVYDCDLEFIGIVRFFEEASDASSSADASRFR